MTQPSPHRAQAGFLPPQKMVAPRAFSLVEVALALGLVAFVMTALFGLLATGLNSSRESSLETAFAQIAQQASSSYDDSEARANPSASRTYSLVYDYEGTPKPPGDPGKFFIVEVQDTPSVIADTSSKLRLLTLSVRTVTSGTNVTKYIQTSAFVP